MIILLIIVICKGDQFQGVGPRKARVLKDGKMVDVKGGLDFGKAVFDEEMGKRCILREEEIETVEKTPILECTHRFDFKVNKTFYIFDSESIPGPSSNVTTLT